MVMVTGLVLLAGTASSAPWTEQNGADPSTATARWERSLGAAAAVERGGAARQAVLGAELLRLAEGAAGQRGAGDAGRKAEVVLDPRRGPGLTSK